ncbi:MAG: class I SAM-dependent RNA methyltransferase [Spirochaetaceae bacterium]|nr:MAG: class I SAM-dependent RNA methyltransferase [Spirochaetaceae bacterium]
MSPFGSIQEQVEVVIAESLYPERELKSHHLSLKIESLISDGRGLARLDGKVFFVSHCLPGESVVARVISDKGSFAEAVCIEVIEGSPERCEPVCAHFGKCGGCSLQYIKPKAQLDFKIQAFLSSLQRIGKLESRAIPDQVEKIEGNSEGYRNRMRFSDANGCWGMKAEKSNQLVALSECPVADPAIQKAIYENLHVGKKEWMVYAADGEIWFSGQKANVAVDGISFSFPVDGFFQSNRDVLSRALPIICGPLETESGRRDSGADMVIADLYGGIGLFSRFFAAGKYSQAVSCVSVDRCPAVQSAIQGVVFRQQSVEQWIRTKEASQRWAMILVDPPRAGLSAAARDYLCKANTNEIRYLSCNPDTFARDAGFLHGAGWNLQRLVALDFYPHTAHLEVYGVFIRE